ncbi:MAG: TatD family hydrolase [Promethearchaeota archaeon]
MKQKSTLPQPKDNLKFIDVHCHLPFPRPARDTLPSDMAQIESYFKMGGLYLISSTIDMYTLKLTLKFKKNMKNYGFTCGWAPQTVTYTSKKEHELQWKEWKKYVNDHPHEFLAIGEIGLDFHHATTLEKREKQVDVLKKIFEFTIPLEKPYVLHVRNAAAPKEIDKAHPDHEFNHEDGANKEILRIIKEFRIPPQRVMWHCFSGPQKYGKILSQQGFTLSVPSSAFGFKKWREVIKEASLSSLVTETDSYYQHPFKRGPINVPANVRYSIAAIAFTLDVSQEEVSKTTIENAKNFFNLELEAS